MYFDCMPQMKKKKKKRFINLLEEVLNIGACMRAHMWGVNPLNFCNHFFPSHIDDADPRIFVPEGDCNAAYMRI